MTKNECEIDLLLLGFKKTLSEFGVTKYEKGEITVTLFKKQDYYLYAVVGKIFINNTASPYNCYSYIDLIGLLQDNFL